MQILITGIQGFIGRHLWQWIADNRPNWKVVGIDCRDGDMPTHHPNLSLKVGDITRMSLDDTIAQSDVVIPLAAVAEPALYVTAPLKVFTLDFEAQLPIIRSCVEHNKLLVFPSTSEVYGCTKSMPFQEDTTALTVGPINKQRWIYSSIKQLLDRVIFAYGMEQNLRYILFRPFNWIGPFMGNLKSRHTTRSLAQFLSDIIHGRPLRLSGGGHQKRCFVDVRDGANALGLLIDHYISGQLTSDIYNIGNPDNEMSITSFAQQLYEKVLQHPLCPKEATHSYMDTVDPKALYGDAYDDIDRRVPCIKKITSLGWKPQISFSETLDYSIDTYLKDYQRV